MLGRPRYGSVGLMAMPGFLIFEMLGPLVEFSGYLLLGLLWAMGSLSVPFTLSFMVVAILYSALVSVLAVLLDDITFRRYPRIRDLGLLILTGIAENLGYRQLTVWWRVRSFWEFWRGDLSWGAMERRGVRRA
jgi:hypothetical protein